jgi:cation transport protein ChaC
MYIFAYGSIIWNPNFKYFRRFKGVLTGYKRDYLIADTHHRGCEDNHGLVLGLVPDEEQSTIGMVFHVEEKFWPEAYQYLKERENPDQPYYLEKNVIINSPFGDIEALTFVANEEHSSFIDLKCERKKANKIKSAHGKSGSNQDYFSNTLLGLSEFNLLHDDDIHLKIDQHL